MHEALSTSFPIYESKRFLTRSKQASYMHPLHSSLEGVRHSIGFAFGEEQVLRKVFPLLPFLLRRILQPLREWADGG